MTSKRGDTRPHRRARSGRNDSRGRCLAASATEPQKRRGPAAPRPMPAARRSDPRRRGTHLMQARVARALPKAAEKPAEPGASCDNSRGRPRWVHNPSPRSIPLRRPPLKAGSSNLLPATQEARSLEGLGVLVQSAPRHQSNSTRSRKSTFVAFGGNGHGHLALLRRKTFCRKRYSRCSSPRRLVFWNLMMRSFPCWITTGGKRPQRPLSAYAVS